MTLKSRLALRLVFMPVMWGSLLFLPAGSFRFWQGWVYFIITLAFILSILGYLYRHDPQLIERRLRGGWRQETVREQKLIMKLIAAIMLATAAIARRAPVRSSTASGHRLIR